MSAITERIGHHHFKIGDFTCIAILDGQLLQPYEGIYPNADPARLAQLKSQYNLPPDNIPMDLNVLFVDTGEHRILVDAGMGSVTIFGDGMGRLTANLAAAGIKPEEIDKILVSHMHPDHIFGLIDGAGAPVFPNARIVVTKEEWDYWIDPAKQDLPDFRATWVKGAIESLAPYEGRIDFVSDNDIVVPGIKVRMAPGHSVGECCYIIGTGNEKLMTLGDVTHHLVYESAHPKWFYSLQYDTIPEKAVESRYLIYKECIAENYLAMGYHFPFPGLGRFSVPADPFDGEYIFIENKK